MSEIPEQKEFFKYIENESESINCNLLKDYFNFESPTVLTKQSYKIKNKNSELVNVIKSGLIDLKEEIEKMSEEEKKKLKNQMKW